MASSSVKNPGPKIDPGQFMNNKEVQDCITRLKTIFGQQYEKLEVSDTMDASGHQYVNLVQKGGGVLGVSLVGYTYILEQVGIRFLRQAGTSAGAINTALLTVIGKKEDAKSEQVLKYICDLNFFDLVDGHPFARWLIRNFIKNQKFEKKAKLYLMILLGAVVGFIFLAILFIGWQKYWIFAVVLSRIFFVLSGFMLVLLGAILFYVSYLFGRLKKCGYGINPGKFFYDWVKDRMEENGVNSVSTLNQKAGAVIPGLKVRHPETQNVNSLIGDVTFITSELVTENKIEFPKMTTLFREEADEMHPAHFVRASMSIPVFFESHMITGIPIDSQVIKDAWFKFLSIEKDIPSIVRFVDGGILSNFPINIFYNPKIVEPRLPSFGIDLDDTVIDPEEANPFNWSLGSYIGHLFNTIRYYYDKDFLLKNSVFRKGVGTIKLANFNWLNFFLSDEDKLKMFIKGAQAATDFLIGFNWPVYQKDRTDMQLLINETQKTDQTILAKIKLRQESEQPSKILSTAS